MRKALNTIVSVAYFSLTVFGLAYLLDLGYRAVWPKDTDEQFYANNIAEYRDAYCLCVERFGIEGCLEGMDRFDYGLYSEYGRDYDCTEHAVEQARQ